MISKISKGGWQFILLLALTFCLPSLIFINIEDRIWEDDSSDYGYRTVYLDHIRHTESLEKWVKASLYIKTHKTPLLMWFGQWFIPLRHTLGSTSHALLFSIMLCSGATLTLLYLLLRDSTVSRHAALAGVLLLSSAPQFIWISKEYLTEPLQLLMITCVLYLFINSKKWERTRVFLYFMLVLSLSALVKSSTLLYIIVPVILTAKNLLSKDAYTSGRGLIKEIKRNLPLALLTLISLLVSVYYYVLFFKEIYTFRTVNCLSGVWVLNSSFPSKFVYITDAILSKNLIIFTSIPILALTIYMLFKRRLLNDPSKHVFPLVLQSLIILLFYSYFGTVTTRFLLGILPYLAYLFAQAIDGARFKNIAYLAVLALIMQSLLLNAQTIGLKSTFMNNPNIKKYNDHQDRLIRYRQFTEDICSLDGASGGYYIHGLGTWMSGYLFFHSIDLTGLDCAPCDVKENIGWIKGESYGGGCRYHIFLDKYNTSLEKQRGEILENNKIPGDCVEVPSRIRDLNGVSGRTVVLKCETLTPKPKKP